MSSTVLICNTKTDHLLISSIEILHMIAENKRQIITITQAKFLVLSVSSICYTLVFCSTFRYYILSKQ